VIGHLYRGRKGRETFIHINFERRNLLSINGHTGGRGGKKKKEEGGSSHPLPRRKEKKGGGARRASVMHPKKKGGEKGETLLSEI